MNIHAFRYFVCVCVCENKNTHAHTLIHMHMYLLRKWEVSYRYSHESAPSHSCFTWHDAHNLGRHGVIREVEAHTAIGPGIHCQRLIKGKC
jgi:hypothetical protein